MAKKKTKAKEPTIKYLVVWDNEDGDPVKPFAKLEDAKELAGGLISGNADVFDKYYINDDPDYVDKETVKVYEVKGLFKPKISVELVPVKK